LIYISLSLNGAGNWVRTGDLYLGKMLLYDFIEIDDLEVTLQPRCLNC